MTDYILRFDDEAELDLPVGDGHCWVSGALTLMPVMVVVSEQVVKESDQGPTIEQPEGYAPGYWLVVSSDGPFHHNRSVPWDQVPGRVTPTFAGRDFPEA